DMRTESQITKDALNLLNSNLGPVETEVFISTILRDPYDYTEWQRKLWEDKSINQVFNEAKDFEKKANK
ncbi:MAG: hypothetical protein KDK38_09325, partial [Leptospiraceae bacterium]|nr:hypothetical protein [Leptospiraceae bacterium]